MAMRGGVQARLDSARRAVPSSPDPHSRRMIPVIAAAPTAVTIQPSTISAQRAHHRMQPQGPRMVEGTHASPCPIITVEIMKGHRPLRQKRH